MKQLSFEKTNWNYRYSHGGTLRKSRAGRKSRPLSRSHPLHLVFKANRECIHGGFRNSKRFALIHKIMRKYSKYFWIKIDQVSIQNDHIHFIVRAPRRSKYGDFFRVFAGQVAQQFEKQGLLNQAQKEPHTAKSWGNSDQVTGTLNRTSKASKCSKFKLKLWKYRPFTRVVVGWKAYKIVQNYVQLNEQEAIGKIQYQNKRLKGLSLADWEILWV